MASLVTDNQHPVVNQGMWPLVMSDKSASSKTSSDLDTQPAEYLGVDNLSVALIGPDEVRREQAHASFLRFRLSLPSWRSLWYVQQRAGRRLAPLAPKV